MASTKRYTNEKAEEILGLYFPVLDYGFCSLIDYFGGDEAIESAARVSYGAGTRKVNQTRGLIRYLMRHHHSTPFEMCELKFHICCPIFVMRQLVRHRAASINEFSQRYSLVPMLFYTPEKDQFRTQSKSNNQGRSNDYLGEQQYIAAVDTWKDSRKRSAKFYEDLVSSDTARELARIDLPLSTYTQFYWSINLHNLFHFLTLRTDEHSQYEIRELANTISGMIKRVAPLSYEAWIDYNVSGKSFSREELNTLRKIIGSGRMIEAVIAESALSSREATEFREKIISEPIPPNFELDLPMAKSPEYFRDLLNNAVPNVDRIIE